MNTTPSPDDLFSTWLAEHRAGRLDAELSIALREVAEEVTVNQKAGAVTLKIALVPAGEDAVVVTHDVTVRHPKVKTETSYFLHDGILSRRDPNQPQLPGTEDTTKAMNR